MGLSTYYRAFLIAALFIYISHLAILSPLSYTLELIIAFYLYISYIILKRFAFYFKRSLVFL